MSALPPKADMCSALGDVRFVPIADHASQQTAFFSIHLVNGELCGRLVSGDRKLKESTPRLAPGRPKPPTMGFDNRAADREAHAHAVWLRRVESFKETRQSFRAQPGAGVSHPQAHRVVLRLARSDEHLWVR